MTLQDLITTQGKRLQKLVAVAGIVAMELLMEACHPAVGRSAGAYQSPLGGTVLEPSRLEGTVVVLAVQGALVRPSLLGHLVLPQVPLAPEPPEFL